MIQMIHLPMYRHVRRFLASMVSIKPFVSSDKLEIVENKKISLGNLRESWNQGTIQFEFSDHRFPPTKNVSNFFKILYF